MTVQTYHCASCGSRFTSEVRFCPQDGSELQPVPETSQPLDPLIGKTIDGRYRIDSTLGAGGMGVVYLITHVALNKRMALKVLRSDASRDEVTVQRFQQEATSSTAIGHPNIVDISDFGRLPDGSAYFVMEHLEGEPLTKRIRRGPMAIDMVIEIGLQMASALGAAHSRGIVHRDLKPDNVFLIHRNETDHFVKVLDFGIAKVGGANSKLTRTGTVFGTPHYMAPEQAAGQSVDARADIYALGVILFEMCTGVVPFDGDTFMGILSAHMFEEPPRPSEIEAAAGPLEGVVMRALAKRPEDRYGSMEALVADLHTIRAGGAVAFERVPSPAVAAGMTGMMAAPPSQSSSAPWLLVGALLVLLVGGAGAGAWFALSGHTEVAQNSSHAPAAGIAAPREVAPAAELEPPAPAEEMVRIEVTSDPIGAAIVVDGAVVGNTPMSFDRPAEGEALMLELRVRDHEPRQVRLASTSVDVRVALEPIESPAPRSGMTRPRRHTMTEPSQTAEVTPMRVQPRHVEVVDPWAQE